MIIGSAVISAGIDAEDWAPTTAGVVPGPPGFGSVLRKSPYETPE